MEEDEQTKFVMQALSGANTNEDDFQDANVRMKVVEMREGEGPYRRRTTRML